ncbi:MAG: BON domain-containing protein [Gammaproteobacteria bacterium WSBS_2016_MAG_OTU1]
MKTLIRARTFIASDTLIGNHLAKAFSILLMLAAPFLLSGCPAALAVGAASGAAVVNDERTTGSFVEDAVVEYKVLSSIISKYTTDVNIGVTSYNRRVLITGQTASEEIKKDVSAIALSIANVREVSNQMNIGNPSSLASRASDSALTARVKFNLCQLQHEGFSCLDIKTVTENGTVYLLGLVSKEQAAIAKETTRRVPGVIKVVLFFEYQ